MRSLSLLLWAACTGLVSATWVCGGNVEITKSYDNKNIEGHCTGASRAASRAALSLLISGCLCSGPTARTRGCVCSTMRLTTARHG